MVGNAYDIIFPQVALIGYNFVNSRLDAYRILKNKSVAHGINFGAYGTFVVFFIFLFKMDASHSVLFGLSAFTQRQFSFDIPLNLRRGLKWNYVSLAKPPKALLDRIEIRFFGYNADAPLFVYGIFYIISITVLIVL